MKQYTEFKRFFDGGTRKYSCQLLFFSQSRCILKYILPSEIRVGDMLLNKGTITLGFYWQNRPFLVYSWYHNQEALGYYFSIIDQLELTPTSLSYRDLVVDVLIDKQLNLSVLDREELSPLCPPTTLDYINSALETIHTEYKQIIAQIESEAKPFLSILN